MQQQQQHINTNNNISTLPCPSILSFSTTSTALKPGNLPHLSASIDTISTTNNSLNSALCSSIYMGTRTGATNYQIPQSSSLLTSTSDAASVPATETALISPSICTMTIPTQNFPPSLAHNQTTVSSTITNNESTSHSNIISTNWSDAKKLEISPYETNLNTTSPFNSHHQPRMFNSNKTLLASTTSTSTTNNHQRSSTTASLLFVRY